MNFIVAFQRFHLMSGKAPGSILSMMVLASRSSIKAGRGRFVELGAGNGDAAAVLLNLGWQGVLYELDYEAAKSLRLRFAEQILTNRLEVMHGNFLDNELDNECVDLVFSSMVLEHLPEHEVNHVLAQSARVLKNQGYFVAFVPGSKRHWGIEDLVAGHFRRYSRRELNSLLLSANLRVRSIFGVTYPISNALFGLSNFLVRRGESQKLAENMKMRTESSGRRDVAWKTSYPTWSKLFLNPVTLSPFFLFQHWFRHHDDCLVLFLEAQKS